MPSWGWCLSYNVSNFHSCIEDNVKAPSANTARKNIYNFCFNDDFVPQVPLAGWGYSKHGITFVKTAGDLYDNNVSFKNDLDVYAADSNKKTVSFNLSGTSSLISHVLLYWENLESYYNDLRIFTRTEAPCITNNLIIPTYNDTYITLYKFFRDIIAPAAMEVDGSSLGVIAPIINQVSDYKRIVLFFVNGSAMSDSIYFGHHAFTYYTASPITIKVSQLLSTGSYFLTNYPSFDPGYLSINGVEASSDHMPIRLANPSSKTISASTPGQNLGNWGLIYNIPLNLYNDTANPMTIKGYIKTDTNGQSEYCIINNNVYSTDSAVLMGNAENQHDSWNWLTQTVPAHSIVSGTYRYVLGTNSCHKKRHIFTIA